MWCHLRGEHSAERTCLLLLTVGSFPPQPHHLSPVLFKQTFLVPHGTWEQRPGLSVSADLGSSSVRAGLQSLEASGHLEDDFDMFALTRGSSLADQRKG